MLEMRNDITADSDAADRFFDLLLRYFELLAHNPSVGRSRHGLRAGYQSFSVGQYMILYRVTDASVEIMHVLHSRRDLGSILK
jgi:toxin ParE1/3/4